MLNIRRSWAGVSAIIAIDPVLLPQHSEIEEFLAALSEFAFEQPTGQYRACFLSGSKSARPKFAEAVGEKMRLIPLKCSENSSAPKEMQRLLSTPVPLYFEDDPNSLGECSVGLKIPG